MKTINPNAIDVYNIMASLFSSLHHHKQT